MEKKDTRSEIIRIGTDLISRQGFNATGIDSVLKEAAVPKGSFYHYFKSKEEFGLAVIDRFVQSFEQRLDTFLNDEEVSPLNRIRNFLETGLARVSQNQYTKGCLIGNLGQEMADQNELFRARLDEVLNVWEVRFASCLSEAQQRCEMSQNQDAQKLAGFIISGWEGAILRAKVMKSPLPMLDFIEVLFATTLR
jgi:TetR/AcrR family transcriptional repressor of nem operon